MEPLYHGGHNLALKPDGPISLTSKPEDFELKSTMIQ